MRDRPARSASSAHSTTARAPRLAFEDVYREFFDEVNRWVRALGGPRRDREDLVQDVFVVVHRRLVDFDGQNLGGWLYRITRNRVRDFRNLRWFSVLLAGSPADDVATGLSETPEALLGDMDERRCLASLLARLPESQRKTLSLFALEGYSGEEIAMNEGVSLNTVWTRIHQARTKLMARAARLRGTGDRSLANGRWLQPRRSHSTAPTYGHPARIAPRHSSQAANP